MLIKNHYFSPESRPDVLIEYLNLLGNKLDTRNYRVILTGNFNSPGINWYNRSFNDEDPLFYARKKAETLFEFIDNKTMR